MKNLITRIIGLYLNSLAIIAPAVASRKGFLLFCRPFRVNMSAKQISYLNSSQQSWFQHNDHRVKVYKWGNGNKRILFLHGWQSHTYRWKSYIDALSPEEYTVYSIDAPGHGLSSGNFLTVPLYSEVVENFIKQQGPFDAIVGHSVGGFTLLYTLYRLPLLPVQKIVLMAPPGEADDFISVFKNTLKLSQKTIDLVIDEFLRRYNVKPDFFSTSTFVGSLNHRGLIIHDEGDVEAPYRYAVRLEQGWSKSKLITTTGLGHNLRSQEVVSHVVNFIGQPVQEYSNA